MFPTKLLTKISKDETGPVGSLTFDIASSTSVGDYSVVTNAPNPRAVYMKHDGTRMYVMAAGNNSIVEYDLITPWDVTTASYSRLQSVNTIDSSIRGMTFSPDGQTAILVGEGSDRIYACTLSTAWDITTLTYTGTFLSTSPETQPRGITAKQDGTSIWVVGASTDTIREYSMSTPWDLSTASLSTAFYVGAQASGARSPVMSALGTSFFIMCSNTHTVYQYDMTTPYDISTASYSSLSYSVGSSNNASLTLSYDDVYWYYGGVTLDRIYQMAF